jgi:hypothetical protein
MYRWPKPAAVKGSFYQSATRVDEVLAFIKKWEQATDPFPESSESVEGHCYVCDRHVNFRVDRVGEQGPNWRETLACPGCDLMNRWRSSVHLFELLVLPQADDAIFITEAVTPLYQALAARYPGIIGSEYFEGRESGELIDTPMGPLRNEDVTGLSFRDRSLHAVLSFDVLEHVPDYKSALKEFYRVLATGGQLLLSVPFIAAEQTRVRARLDANGEIEHLCDPIYHGDPMSEGGVLCFHEFGMDMLKEMKNAGFEECFLVCFASVEWAYVPAQVMFVGRKRT